MTKLTLVSSAHGTYNSAPIITYHLVERRDRRMGPPPVIIAAQCDNQEHARRLTACWNACDDISTENLEDNLPMKEIARRHNAVIDQRDKLLAAMQQLAEALAKIDVLQRTANGHQGALQRAQDRWFAAGKDAERQRDELLAAAQRLADLGFFRPVSCASAEQLAAMTAMSTAITSITNDIN